jgi:hypothetical protein
VQIDQIFGKRKVCWVNFILRGDDKRPSSASFRK